MMAFLAIAGNAVWGQTYGTQENPVEINISFMYNSSAAAPTGNGFTAIRGNETGDNPYSNTLDITAGGYYKLIGTESNIQITVSEKEDPVYITFASGIHVDASLDNTVDTPSRVSGDGHIGSGVWSDRCAMVIVAGAHVTLDWEGNVELSSGGDRAGINVKPEATLVLKGTHSGTLTGTSWNNQNNIYTSGAGIGGDSVDPNFGTIIIESGTVVGRCFAQVSNWRAYGAGIGGGFKVTDGSQTPAKGTSSKAGTIIIKGGNVTGTTNYPGGSNVNPTTGISAAIGGSYAGTCTNIAILGGTVNATTGTDLDADAIGVGANYKINNEKGGISKGIVIGKWDENSKMPEINNTAEVNNVNLVDGRENISSASGTVTMPDNTQIYVEDLKINDGATFNAYHLDLQRTVFNENHNVDWSGAETAENYYLGKGQSIEMDALNCNATEDKDLFLGWYNSDNDVVTVVNSKTTFTAGNTSSKDVTYYAVWVESEHPIVVETETTWSKGDKLTPEINYVSKEIPDVLNALTFQFGDLSSYPELTNWEFDGNQILGTTKLQNDDTYKELKLTATVKLGNGATQDISIPVYIVEASIINTASINMNQKHVYTGNNHNGSDLNGQEHLLSVQMTKNLEGDDLDDPVKLTEGTHYRIYSYTYDNKTVPAKSDGEESVELIDAGEYSQITIEALQATISADLNADHGQQYTISGTVTIAQRPLEISFSLAEKEIEEGQEPNINMVNVQSEAYNANEKRGLVKEEEPTISYEIGYKYNDEQTEMTVFITNIEVADEGENGFKKSNYNVVCNVNGKLYKLPGETVGDDEDDVNPFPDDSEDPDGGIIIGTIDVVPPASTGDGGSFNDHRYQLFLANKDYLKTDEKTVEYYEDLKLELFSRHNKKYTDAGGSFTVWYEKDGVANPGGYRLFWSKSGERGDYQEVKFDPVSEYFRIDNVHSDVYVKIYDADGFPVANEAITAQDFRAYAQANKIIVITPQPTDVQIISMAGAVVATDKVTGHREFANLAEGVYIVRMGETIVKLQVRN